MAMDIKNSKQLLDPKNFKIKMLIYSLPGLGKTQFLGTANDIAPNALGVGACEWGHGKGLLTIADKGIDYVEPENMRDLEAFCKGQIFKDKQVLGLDSLSAMAKTFVKDYALTIPRSRGDSPKRSLGIP
jgi:hypothetical protein